MEIPPLMLRKSDGGYLYATTDMATIQERIETFGAEQIIYVVDGRQGLHFEQVFRGARKAGFKAQYEFIGFGTMNGPDNKPFKTRAGGVMRLEELINQLVTEAKNRMQEAGIEADPKTAHQIGMAALKFADLQHDATQNYQFDIQKFIQFEGKTGPYLLYAAVRIKSILAKAAEMNLKASDTLVEPQNDVERGLQLILSRYPEYILRAYDKRAPNILCDFAYELAQQFSRFYTHCPILKEPDQAAPRLRLCHLALKQLETVLNLLAIEVPQQM
jgi:arginyl-tRNA synthetase